MAAAVLLMRNPLSVVWRGPGGGLVSERARGQNLDHTSASECTGIPEEIVTTLINSVCYATFPPKNLSNRSRWAAHSLFVTGSS